MHLHITTHFLQLFAEMAQEEMEVDLQPVAGFSVENVRTLPAEPSGPHPAALSEGGDGAAVLPADDAAATPSAGRAGEAAAEPDPQLGPAAVLNRLQRLQGAFDPYWPLPAPQLTQHPRARRARRQQRVGGSQRTVSTR